LIASEHLAIKWTAKLAVRAAMTGVEINQYQIDKVQINTEEVFQVVAQWNKCQQDFINNLHDQLDKVKILTKGMAESVALKTTIDAWEEKFYFLKKDAWDFCCEREELECSINHTSFLAAVMNFFQGKGTEPMRQGLKPSRSWWKHNLLQ
jgi:hypothetical protein